MIAAVTSGNVRDGTAFVCGNGNRERRGIPQIGRKHQHQRRNDAERKKRIERRQNSAQVSRQTCGESPSDCPCCQSAESRNGARSGSHLQPRLALRALHVIRTRHGHRRRNFRLAMRTHANSHGSPPRWSIYNNRNRPAKKRKDGERRTWHNCSGVKASPLRTRMRN